MTTPIKTTPSLLTLTAPSGDAARNDTDSARFADELSAVTSQPEPTPSRSESDTGAFDPPDQQTTDATGSDAEGDRNDAAIHTEDGQITPEETEAAGELLAVTFVSETIVAETSPNATLPEHAATLVNVGLTIEQNTLSQESSIDAPQTDPLSAENLADLDLLTEQPIEPPGPTIEPNRGSESDPNQSAGPLGEFPGNHQNEGQAVLSQQPSDRVAIDNASDATEQPTPPSQHTEESGGERPDLNRPQGASSTGPQETPVAEASASSETTPPRDAGSTAGPPPIESAQERAAAVRAEPTDSRPAVDPARFVSRVSRAIETAHERGGGPIEIRLSPPELGSLRVQIELKEGVLSASLEAETPAARNTLLDNLPALRERLEQQQIRLEKFDVDVRDDSQQRGGGQAGLEQDNQRRSDESPDRREPAREREADQEIGPSEASRRASTITFDDDGLNLVA